MADITTHTNSVRPDRMEFLTTSERIPDRVTRLENAIANGLVAPGISETHLRTGGWGAATATAANTWKTIPVPTTPAPDISPTGAFTIDADGGITIRDTGVYLILAGVYQTAATGWTASIGGLPNANNFWDEATSPAAAIITLATTLRVSGSQKVYLTIVTTAIGNAQVRYFTVDRLGAGIVGPSGPQGIQGIQGPQGIQGVQGVVGPGGTMEYYSQPGQPASTNPGAIWIDTDEAPTSIAPAGQRISSVEYTANSGSIATGVESSEIFVAHSFGVVPSIVVGHLEDGVWSHQCGWRVSTKSTTQVGIRFRNNGPNTATAILRFRLIY